MSDPLGVATNFWDVFPVLLGSATTITVALLVAYFATRRETVKQLRQRHFEFRDERALAYSEFAEAMNRALGGYFNYRRLDAFLDKLDPKALDEGALKLDTAVMKIQIVAPEYVAHACLNVNGRIQSMCIAAETQSESPITSDDLELAKRNMIKVMKVDLRKIEQAQDRGEYVRISAKENTRYFKEIGMKEPSK